MQRVEVDPTVEMKRVGVFPFEMSVSIKFSRSFSFKGYSSPSQIDDLGTFHTSRLENFIALSTVILLIVV